MHDGTVGADTKQIVWVVIKKWKDDGQGVHGRITFQRAGDPADSPCSPAGAARRFLSLRSMYLLVPGGLGLGLHEIINNAIRSGSIRLLQ